MEKAVDAEALKYQFSKFVQLVSAQFERIDFPLRKRAEVVAWLIKQFQQCGVFAYVDSAVFTAADNLVNTFVFMNKLLLSFLDFFGLC